MIEVASNPNPRWNAGNASINVTVLFNGEEARYTTVQGDELFNALVAGVYGPVSEYGGSVPEARATKLAHIETTAGALLDTGVPVAGGLHISLSDGSRADISAMATTAIAALSGATPWPTSYASGWITTENTRVPMPAPADGLSLAYLAGDFYAKVVQRRRDLKDQVLAADTVAAINAIDADTGWPA